MFAKESITLTGTEHDTEGTIKITSECHGFVMEKRTAYDNGNMNLTAMELYALVEKLEAEYPRQMEAGKEQLEQYKNRN